MLLGDLVRGVLLVQEGLACFDNILDASQSVTGGSCLPLCRHLPP